MSNIHTWRKDTPGCQMYTHLNNAGASYPPQIVVDTICQYLQQESLRGGYEIHALRNEEISGFYTAVAKLLNAQARNIAFVGSATDAFARAMNSIPFEKGDIILTTMQDYAANQISYLSMIKRLGIELIRVPNAPEGDLDLTEMEAAIKKHQPKLVSISHVPTNSGLVQPIEEVGKLCQKYEVLYLVDACQSAGQMPLDVEKIACDFLMSAFRKWMRGPRGTGFLYVSNKVLQKGYSPVCLDGGGAMWTNENEYQLADSALRYQFWELNYGLVLGAKVAAEYALEVGLGNIEKRVLELATYTRQQLASKLGATIQDKGVRQCGIVTASFEKIELSKLTNHLMKNQVNVSFAQRNHAVIDMDDKGIDWALRVSPHYYNTKEEIDYLVKIMEEFLG